MLRVVRGGGGGGPGAEHHLPGLIGVPFVIWSVANLDSQPTGQPPSAAGASE